MSVSKLNRGARVALMALAMLATSAQVARAETIFLTCSGSDFGTYTIDLTNKTVNNTPAQIDTTSIDWQTNLDWGGGNTRVEYWHIDRAAGTITLSYQTHFANGFVPARVVTTAPCTKGSAPATKF